MGTNDAPLLGDLFLYTDEFLMEFINKPEEQKQLPLSHFLTFTSHVTSVVNIVCKILY